MPRFKNNTRQLSEVPIPHPKQSGEVRYWEACISSSYEIIYIHKIPIDGKPHKSPYQSTRHRIGVAHVSQSPVTQIATIRHVEACN